ncbi:MAG: hypothetical protein D6753_17980 [Planctomycetota bacterium]|nr:MAG: hypothetical protein D6753_17980 [Planctomycetota bacterium]
MRCDGRRPEPAVCNVPWQSDPDGHLPRGGLLADGFFSINSIPNDPTPRRADLAGKHRNWQRPWLDALVQVESETQC